MATVALMPESEQTQMHSEFEELICKVGNDVSWKGSPCDIRKDKQHQGMARLNIVGHINFSFILVIMDIRVL